MIKVKRRFMDVVSTSDEFLTSGVDIGGWMLLTGQDEDK